MKYEESTGVELPRIAPRDAPSKPELTVDAVTADVPFLYPVVVELDTTAVSSIGARAVKDRAAPYV